MFKIILADDSRTIRAILKKHLATIATENHREIEIYEVETGIEAVEETQKILPDLVIMDINMPFTDGFEAGEILKSDPATSHIPIIILSARADPDSRAKIINIGIDDYIVKPPTLEILRDTVTRYL